MLFFWVLMEKNKATLCCIWTKMHLAPRPLGGPLPYGRPTPEVCPISGCRPSWTLWWKRETCNLAGGGGDTGDGSERLFLFVQQGGGFRCLHLCRVAIYSQKSPRYVQSTVCDLRAVSLPPFLCPSILSFTASLTPPPHPTPPHLPQAVILYCLQQPVAASALYANEARGCQRSMLHSSFSHGWLAASMLAKLASSDYEHPVRMILTKHNMGVVLLQTTVLRSTTEGLQIAIWVPSLAKEKCQFFPLFFPITVRAPVL